MERLGVMGCRAGDAAAVLGRRCGDATIGVDGMLLLASYPSHPS